jgi:hypothetical protein
MVKYEDAFQVFEKGDFLEALKLSIDKIKQKEYSIEETPYVECKLVIAAWLFLKNSKVEAYREVLTLMKLGIINEEILNFFMFMLGYNQRAVDVPLIIGLGSGRSGSTSLTVALTDIENSYFSHEHPAYIPWAGGEALVDWHLDRLLALGKHYSVVGDVAHWWLPYVEYIIQRHPKTIFIATKRERESTIRSFIKIKGGGRKGTINHWSEHDGSYFKKNIWDSCYPSYSADLSINESLLRYWDDYYSECARLKEKYSKNFLILDIADSMKDLVLKNFVEYFIGPIGKKMSFGHKNVGTALEGFDLIPTPKTFLL